MKEPDLMTVEFLGKQFEIRPNRMSRRPEVEGKILVVMQSGNIEFMYFVPQGAQTVKYWQEMKNSGARGWMEWPKVIELQL